MASFRPGVTPDGVYTRILVEQTTVVDPQRLGRSAGRLAPDELRLLERMRWPTLRSCVVS
jgi:mRNA interferase MazF